MKKPNFTGGLLASLIVVAAIGGVAPPLAKFALGEIPPFGYVFVRLLVSVLVMLVTMRVMKQKPKLVNFKKFAPVASFWWLNALIFTLGLEKTTATTGQFIHISIPIITAIIAISVLQEKLVPAQWLASILAATGVGMVILSGGSLSFGDKHFIGNMMILSSAACFSVYAVYSKKKEYEYLTANEMIFIGSVCGTIALLVPAIIEYQSNRWVQSVSLSSSAAMVGAVTAVSVFYLGFQKLIKKHGPSIATTNLYLLPGFVVFWAAIILNERVSLMEGAGALLAVFGVGLFTKLSKRSIQ